MTEIIQHFTSRNLTPNRPSTRFIAMKSLRVSLSLILAAVFLALAGCQGMPANVPTPAAQSPDVRSPSQPKPPTP